MRGIHIFKCEACGQRDEYLIRKDSDVPTVCPQCGSARLVHVIGAANFVLKGTGWYETDFKDKKTKKGK